MRTFKFQERMVKAAVGHLDSMTKMSSDAMGFNDRRILFKSDTGTGKSIMLGMILNQSESARTSINFVVVPSVGNLAFQTFTKVKATLAEGRQAYFLTVEELANVTNPIPGDVYVLSYSKIIVRDRVSQEYKNKMTREGEGTNLWDLLDTIRSAGVNVNTFIDEAHYGSQSRAAKAIGLFFKDFHAALGYTPVRVEVTATPTMAVTDEGMDNGFHARVTLSKEESETSGLRRKKLILNSDEGGFSNSEEGAILKKDNERKFYLEMAWRKYLKLCAAYEAHKVGYLPLLAIQLPNVTQGAAELKTLVEEFFADKTDPVTGKTIDYSSGHLAVRLTDQDTNARDMQSLNDLDSPVRVLVYKTAASLGWDCPRAHILIGFRSIMSDVFNIQNLGRFQRTTGAKHYGDNVMDYGYVYSDISNYEVPKETAEILYPEEISLKADPVALNRIVALCLPPIRAVAKGRSRGLQAADFAPKVYAWLEEHWSAEWHQDILQGIDKIGRHRVVDADMSANAAGEMSAFIDENKAFDFAAEIIHGLLPEEIVEGRATAERIRGAIQSSLKKKICTGVDNKYLCSALHMFLPPLVSQIGEDLTFDTRATAVGRRNYVMEQGNPLVPWSEISYATSTKAKEKAESRNLQNHLYGALPAVSKVSRSEELFEDDILEKNAFLGENTVWMKHSGERNERFLSIAYRKMDGTVHEMYPDYVGVTNINGLDVPFIFEVKGDHFEDASGDDSRFAKARALRKYARNTGAIATAVYKRGSTWYAVSDGESGGDLREELLSDFTRRWRTGERRYTGEQPRI